MKIENEQKILLDQHAKAIDGFLWLPCSKKY